VIWLAGLPHRHVQRVILVRVIGPAAVLGGQPQALGPVQAGTVDGYLAPEVDAAPALVRAPGGQQPDGQPDHVLDVAVRARLVPRRAHAERGHIPVEVKLTDGGELVVRRAGLLRRGIQHVVDVGDVPAQLGLDAEELQAAAQRVDPDEGGRMPEVRHVVGRDSAGVDAGLVQHRQPVAGDGRPGQPGRPMGGCMDGGHGSSVGHQGRAHHRGPRTWPGSAAVADLLNW
jgi:hypothetical protein